MKKYLMIIIALSSTVFFTACGGGGTSDGGGSTQITVAACETPDVIANYTLLQSGDTIVKDEASTVINTFHDVDGNKRICVSSGSAHILR